MRFEFLIILINKGAVNQPLFIFQNLSGMID
jgi:hypothetical protein